MNWNTGGIPTVIAESRRRQQIFVVYVSGNDDLSKKMDDTWDNNEVAELSSNNCVAIKLKANTEQCVQFSAIYPVVCVPSSYFIGLDGKPIEIMVGHHEPRDFVTKMQSVIQAHKGQISAQPGVEPPSEPNISQAQGNSEAATQMRREGAEGGAMPELTKEEKVQSMEEKQKRARELITAKQEQKALEAKEKEKSEELNRRQLGKNIQKLREKQEEQERQETANSWKKEREEAKLAREKVRQQIERDRLERKAAYEREKAEREEQRQEKARVKAEVQAAEQAKTEAQKRESARLQFRLPDGSSVTETFPSSDTLNSATTFLRSRIGATYGNFALTQTYPRRDFSETDGSCSLLELGLAPSAALIVIPHSRKKTSTVSSSDGGIMALLMLLLTPVIWLGNFLLSIFSFGTSSSNAASQAQSSQPNASPAASTRQRPTRPEGSNVRSRQEGNIRRFTNTMDDDDDMNTYNGNSTQQM